MQTVTAATPDLRRWTGWLSPAAVVIYWIMAGGGLVFALGAPPVQRTQEARVLETAREMPGTGWRGWMLPHLNGNLRLRKPPLAYWMAASAYKLGGVSEGVGRVPTVVLGWLTVGLTFGCARWLFGARAGFFAAGCLLCSYLFFRYTRLAETDAPAMFFVTLGVVAFWKAIGWKTIGDNAKPGSIVWFHVAAAGSALAVMSKGPPGAYPPLFFVVMVLWTRRWEAVARFLLSGALLTFAVIAAPWFWYVLHTAGIEQWKRELDELGGEDHPGHFWQYFYELFVAVTPWCLLLPAGLIAAVQRWRDSRLAGLLIWIAVILVPLCFVGNKQFHYLLPLMPPVMILIGWWIDLALCSRRRVPLIDVTIAVSVLAAPAVLVTAKLLEGRIGTLDYALAGLIVLLLALVATVYRTRGPVAGAAGYVGAVLLVFVPTVGSWMPLKEPDGSRNVAWQITKQFGAGPYCFYGPNYSLPLCFNLRSTIPQVKTAEQLEALAARDQGLVVIVQTKSKFKPPPVPTGFREQMKIVRHGQVFDLYRRG